MKSIFLPSYAKVNIGLSVLGKRADGFHEIETFLQQVDLKDEIRLGLRSDTEITLSCARADIPTDERNLCVAAARLLCETTGVSFGVDMRLTKNIPVGAGLGGGSSNAAVVLLALNKLLSLDLGVARLEALAAHLGSDVPFFIRGGAALASGRGEVLRPEQPMSGKWMVLIVFPRVMISTAWAYASLNLDLTINKKYITLSSFKGRCDEETALFKVAKNDFERAVFLKYPELAEVKRGLLDSGASYASLSGSGSALFGIFRREEDVRRAQDSFPAMYDVIPVRFTSWGISDVD